ncbi:MAG TPA: hypothetical protein VGO47_00240, partial [Chlamydiales bacterium]|nr:hypothetical protein [Chlamydiales bacterium]
MNLTYPQQVPLPTIDDDDLANARIRPLTRPRNAHQAMKLLSDAANKAPDTKRQFPSDLSCPVDSCDFQSAVLSCAQKIPPWCRFPFVRG